ncbi:MAG: type II toxin-antitoxin system VapC family toxin [Leptospiraceae bacterium]|nr:type II toxin-antitoxin system VapC family toxin [Leptospiraceae bacterium]
MKYILDTNVCINFLKGNIPSLAKKFSSVSKENRIIPSVVRAELFYGAYKSTFPEKNIKVVKEFLNLHPELDFDSKSSEIYGQIRTDLEKKGTPIGPYDLQIAAITIANNCILVTHNTKEFSRVNNLQIEDWEISANS